MSKRRRILSYDEKAEILRLRALKLSYQSIGDKIGRPKSTVSTFVVRYQKTHTIINKPRSGRPQKVTKRTQRQIIRSSIIDPWASSSEIKSGLQLKLSSSMVRKVLVDTGLKARKPKKSPYTNKKIRLRRMNYMRDHINWSLDKWKRVIFSDETTICMKRDNQGQYVRCKVGQSTRPEYVLKTWKFGGGKVMFWAAITYDSRTDLVPVHGTMNRHTYVQLLDQHLLPFIYGQSMMSRNPMIFLQDGASCHTAHFTQDYFIANQISVLQDWPAYSPDLNPIENVWAILKRKLGSYNYSHQEALIDRAQKVWNSISQKQIQNTIESIHR